jgi:hypothetical protein
MVKKTVETPVIEPDEIDVDEVEIDEVDEVDESNNEVGETNFDVQEESETTETESNINIHDLQVELNSLREFHLHIKKSSERIESAKRAVAEAGKRVKELREDHEKYIKEFEPRTPLNEADLPLWQTPPPKPVDDSWREKTIENLSLKENDIEKLHGGGFKKCGEVSDWLSKDFIELRQGCNRKDFRDRVIDALAIISGSEAQAQAEIAELNVSSEEVADAYIPAINPREYILQTEGKPNRILFVAERGGQFATHYTDETGNIKRYTAKALGWSSSFEAAQTNLDEVAANEGLEIHSSPLEIPDVNEATIAELLQTIEDCMLEDQYAFANDTLVGISDWVVKNKYFTKRQYEAVQNIVTAGHRSYH